MGFDPKKYGAKEVKEEPKGFDPSKYGATEIVTQKKNEAAPLSGAPVGLQRYSTYDWLKDPILNPPKKFGVTQPAEKPKTNPQAIKNWGQQAKAKAESNLQTLGVQPNEQFVDENVAQEAAKQTDRISFDALQKDFNTLFKAPAVGESTRLNIVLPKGVEAPKTAVQQANENIGQIRNVQREKRKDIALIHGAEIAKKNPQLAPIEVGKSVLKVADPDLYKAWERGGFQDRLVQRQAEELGIEATAATGRDDGTMELLAQDIDRLNLKYPEEQENIVRHKIAAKAYEKAGVGKFTGGIWTVEKMDEIAKELSPEDKAVYDKYIRPEEEALGMAITNMPNWGLAKFGGGFTQIAESSVLGLANLVGARSDADLENERLASATDTKYADVGESPFIRNRVTQLQNKKDKSAEEIYELEELKQTENAIGTAGKFVGGASAMTGQVAAFALTARGLGNILSTPFARAGLLQTGGRAAAGIEGIATTALDFGIKKGVFDMIGMIATGYVASDNDARKQALQMFPNDEDSGKRTAYAETIKVSTALSEMVFPETKLLDLFQSNFNRNVAKFVKGVNLSTIGSVEFKTGIKQAAQDALKFGELATKNINKEALEEVIPIISDVAAMSILAPDKLQMDDKIEEMWNTYASMAVDGSVVGMLGGLRDYRQSKAQLPFVSNLGRAGFEDFTNAVNLEIDKQEVSGELSPEKAAEKKQIIEAITNQNAIVDKTPTLAKMKGRQREKYVAMAVAEQLKKKEAMQVMMADPVAARVLNSEVAESEAVREGILTGTNFVTEDGGVIPTSEAAKIEEAKPRRLAGRLARKPKEEAQPVVAEVAAEIPATEAAQKPPEVVQEVVAAAPTVSETPAKDIVVGGKVVDNEGVEYDVVSIGTSRKGTPQVEVKQPKITKEETEEAARRTVFGRNENRFLYKSHNDPKFIKEQAIPIAQEFSDKLKLNDSQSTKTLDISDVKSVAVAPAAAPTVSETPVENNFENKSLLEDSVAKEYNGQKDVVFHGSEDISYLNDVSDLNPNDNTKNAKSKYTSVNPKPSVAVTYSASYNGFGQKSGVAAFKLRGKKYTLKKSDILSLKTNDDYEAFYDKKKSEGFDYVEVPQDGGNIVVLNNDAITLVGKKYNREIFNKNTENEQNNKTSIGKDSNITKQDSGQSEGSPTSANVSGSSNQARSVAADPAKEEAPKAKAAEKNEPIAATPKVNQPTPKDKPKAATENKAGVAEAVQPSADSVGGGRAEGSVAVLNENDAEIKRLVAAVGGNIYDFGGDYNSATRQRLIQLITGEKLPKAKAGVNKVKEVVEKYAGVDTNQSGASVTADIKKWAESGSVENVKITPEEKEVIKELNITQDEAKRAKSAEPKRTRKSKDVVNAIKIEAADVERSQNAERATELISTIESAEEAILRNKPVDESFEKEHGISEVALANEYNSMDKNANIFVAYENLTGNKLETDTKASEWNPSDNTVKIVSKFLEAIGKEGIKLKKPIEMDFLVIGTSPKTAKPLNKKGIDVLEKVVAKDEMRPALQSVYFDGDNMVVTDANSLVIVKRTESDAEIIKKAKEAYVKDRQKAIGAAAAKKLADEKFAPLEESGLNESAINMKTGEILDGKFPNYKVVIPENIEVTDNIDIQELINTVNGAKETLGNGKKDSNAIVFKVEGGMEAFEIGFNPTLMLNNLQALQAAGAKKVEVSFSAPNKAVVLKTDNKNMGLVMPLLVSEDTKLPMSKPIPIKVSVSEEALKKKIADIENQVGYAQERLNEIDKDDDLYDFYKERAEKEKQENIAAVEKYKKLLGNSRIEETKSKTGNIPVLPSEGELISYPSRDGKSFINYFSKDGKWNFIDSRGRTVKETEGKQAEITEYWQRVSGKLLEKSFTNSEGDTVQVGKFIERAQAILKALFPDASFVVYESSYDYQQATGDMFGRGSYDPATKTVALNLEKMKRDGAAKTEIHEVIHPIVREAISSDANALNILWERVAELKDVAGMEKVWQHVLNYNESQQAEEGVTEFITRVVDGTIDLSKVPESISTKIIDIINKIFEALGLPVVIGTQTDIGRLSKAVKIAFETGDISGIQKALGRPVKKLAMPTVILREMGDRTLEQLAPEFEQDIADILEEFPDATLEEIMEEVEASRPELVATDELRAETEKRVAAILSPTLTPLQKAIKGMQAAGAKGKKFVAKTKQELAKVMESVFGLNEEKAEATAEIAHLLIAAEAKLNGISVAEQYQRYAFAQAEGAMNEALYQQFAEPSDFDENGKLRPEVAAEIAAERAEIERKAKADGTWMKAPNGKPTNLNEAQYVTVRTKRFKNWFKDSNVVDENGEPIVVYTGTPNPGFDEFSFEFSSDETLAFGKGVYTSVSPVAASGYAKAGASWGNKQFEGTGGVYPLFIKSKKPFDLDAFIPYDVAMDIIKNAPSDIKNRKEIKEIIDEAQFDSTYYDEEIDDAYNQKREFEANSDEEIDPNDYDDGYEDVDYKKDYERELSRYDKRIEQKEKDLERAVSEHEQSIAAGRTGSIRGRDLYEAIWKSLPEYYDWKVESQLFGGESAIFEFKTTANEILSESGFDSITHIDKYNPGGGGKHKVYIAFQPTQIKSATANVGTFSPNTGNILYQAEAWHGSPYSFDRFTTEKMGTGEGAQAFGWGLYFTDLESIAKNYAEKLYQEKWEVDKLDVKDFENTDFDIIDTAYLLQALRKGHNKIDNTYNKSKSLSFVEERMRYSEKEIWKKVYDKIKNAKTINPVINKNLYKVTLHKGKTPAEYDWLVWDKPVPKKQLDKINRQLDEFDGWNDGRFFTDNDEIAEENKKAVLVENGKDLYEYISKQYWKWEGDRADFSSNKKMDKDASLFLLDLGIDGVKYPAESIARGATTDTARGFNYVVFDENAVTIEERILFQNQQELPEKKISVNGKELTVKPLPEGLAVVNGFYSPIEKRILEFKQPTASATKWKEIVGTKEEAKFTGVAEWLDTKKPNEQVSKADVLAWMRDNRIEVVEVVKDDVSRMSKSDLEKLGVTFEVLNKKQYISKYGQELWDIVGYNDNDIVYRANRPEVTTEETKDINTIEQVNTSIESVADYMSADIDYNVPNSRITKFKQYQLEGDKSNYVELYLVLPKEGAMGKVADWRVPSAHSSGDVFVDTRQIVRIRANQRVDAEGNKILFVEEFQGDKGQEGRKVGFKNNDAEKIRNEIKAIEDKLVEKTNIAKHNLYYYIKDNPTDELVKALDKKHDELLKVGDRFNDNGLPADPFSIETANWVKIGLKVMARYAVNNGLSKISWTTGEQQNERYDLSKQVDKIESVRKADGTYQVTATKDRQDIFSENGIDAKRIEDVFGKDIAQKIVSNERQYTNIEGDNLKAGGKGMKGFYGSPTEGTLGIVGKVAESLFKQTPKTVEISIGEKYADYQWTTDSDGNDIIEYKGERYEFEKESDAEAFVAKIKSDTSTQHSIDITPDIIAEVTQGMPLFQNKGLGAQGAIVMQAANRVVYAMTNPNVTTPLHEMAHGYFDTLISAAENGNAQAAADVKVFAEQAGVNPADLRTDEAAYTKAQELFARGFERYLRDGKAPTPELQSLFDKFKNWLLEIYKSLSESPIDVQLNDAMRSVYGRMLTPEQVKQDFPPKPPVSNPLTDSENEGVRGISYAETEKDRIEAGLPLRESTVSKPDEELEAEANALIESGWNFEKNIDKVLSGEKILSDAEQLALGKYKIYLNDIATKSPTNANINAYERALKALESTGKFAARALRARQLPVNPEPTLPDFLVRQKEESGVDELTPAQFEQNKKEFEALQKASQEWEAKFKALEAEAIAKAAEENLSSKKKNKPKTPRTKENIRKERDEILQRMKDRIKKAKEGKTFEVDGEQVSIQQADIVPFMRELIAIAPEVPALVSNYIEEGIFELSEIAKRLKTDLENEVPGITEEDAIALIAGEYKTGNKKTRNEIQKLLYDLRAEAKLIGQLQALENGEVPKNESKKVERNRKLTELRKQIKAHPNNQLPEYKKQVQRNIDKLQRDLDSGNFAAPPKKLTVTLDKEARELKRKLVDLKTEREVRLLREAYEKMGIGQKVGEKLLKVANIPRTLMASMDFSAPLRQAVIATIGNPTLAFKGFGSMFKAAFNKGYMDEWFFDLENDPNYEIMKEAGLSIADPNSPFLRAREEAFMSGYVEKVEGFIGEKLFGNKNFGFVQGSERAYVMYLNKMRVDLFNKYAAALEQKGKTYDNSPDTYKAIAKYVNNVTGRGNMGKAEEIAKFSNALFFSPRLIASRLSLMNPYYIYKMPSDVRKIYVKDMASFIATGLTVIGMIYLAGGGDEEDDIWVETDPRSSDFMKIRQGEKRWDIWGGFQQYVRTMVQYFSGEKKSPTTDEITELKEDAPYGETRGKLLTRFVRNKLAPIPSSIWDLTSGRNSVGEKVTFKDEIISSVTPLLWQQVYEVAKAEGAVAAITIGVPSVFGVGTERYGERAIEAPDKIKVGAKEYKLSKEMQEKLQVMIEAETKVITDKAKKMSEYESGTKKQKVELISTAKLLARKEATKDFQKKYKNEFPEETAAEKRQRKDEEDKKADLNKSVKKLMK